MPAPKGTRPPNAGKGRPKGASNRKNRALREMILGGVTRYMLDHTDLPVLMRH